MLLQIVEASSCAHSLAYSRPWRSRPHGVIAGASCPKPITSLGGWLFPDRMEIRAHDWTPGPRIEWRTAMEAAHASRFAIICSDMRKAVTGSVRNAERNGLLLPDLLYGKVTHGGRPISVWLIAYQSPCEARAIRRTFASLINTKRRPCSAGRSCSIAGGFQVQYLISGSALSCSFVAFKTARSGNHSLLVSDV